MKEEALLVEAIIEKMGPLFCRDVFTEKTTFRFTLGSSAITVQMDADCLEVEKDAPQAAADCSCRTSAEMFRKIWYDGYQPGIMDFLSGGIVCDAPFLLPQFLRAFGKM